METVSVSRELHRPRLVQVDALRGLAALAVVLFHYTYMYDVYFHRSARPAFAFRHGDLGVHLFFIISGFVILMSVERSSLLDFVVSRTSRLYPAYWVAATITFVVVSATGLWPAEPIRLGDFAVNLTMLQGYLGVPYVDGVYWTLKVELAFYGLVAALLVFRLLRYLEVISVALLAATLAYWIARERDLFASSSSAVKLVDNALLALLAAQYMPLFISGIMVYRVFRRGASGWTWSIMAASILVTTIKDGWLVGSAHLTFVGLILLAIDSRLSILAARPFQFLGSISYALYLVHCNLGYSILRRLDRSGVEPNLAVGVAMLTSIAVATVICRYVELPALHWSRSRYRQWRARDGVADPAGVRSSSPSASVSSSG